MKRIEFIDGYRGLAILLVILFHAFSRWSVLIPISSTFSSFPMFQFGYLGVNLFFIVSGFVILLTLEHSKTLSSFLMRRWIRLFPAMIIATILIFFTASYLHERPRGIPSLRSIIPGLIFIEPTWLKAIFKVPFTAIEGSFWSLFVEVKFYFVFGLLYFYFGRSKAILGLLILYGCAALSSLFCLTLLDKIFYTLSFKQFFWFICGCYAYLFFRQNKIKHLLYCWVIGLIGIIQIDLETHLHNQLIAQLILLVIFVAPLYFDKVQLIFCNPIFLFLGFISYPLYLIHENALVSLTIKLNHHFKNHIPQLLIHLIPISILIFLAYIIAKYLEPFLKITLTKIITLLSNN